MKFDPRRHERMPTVGAVMTPFPYFVQLDDSVEAVERIIAEHDVRHVPVEHEGRVVGLVSERDLHRLVNPALPRVDKARIRVRAIVQGDAYLVEMTAPLSRVAADMAARKIGSAIVVRNGRLAGILSVVDVCRVLAELLDSLFETTDDGAA